MSWFKSKSNSGGSKKLTPQETAYKQRQAEARAREVERRYERLRREALENEEAMLAQSIPSSKARNIYSSSHIVHMESDPSNLPNSTKSRTSRDPPGSMTSPFGDAKPSTLAHSSSEATSSSSSAIPPSSHNFPSSLPSSPLKKKHANTSPASQLSSSGSSSSSSSSSGSRKLPPSLSLPASPPESSFSPPHSTSPPSPSPPPSPPANSSSSSSSSSSFSSSFSSSSSTSASTKRSTRDRTRPRREAAREKSQAGREQDRKKGQSGDGDREKNDKNRERDRIDSVGDTGNHIGSGIATGDFDREEKRARGSSFRSKKTSNSSTGEIDRANSFGSNGALERKLQLYREYYQQEREGRIKDREVFYKRKSQLKGESAVLRKQLEEHRELVAKLDEELAQSKSLAQVNAIKEKPVPESIIEKNQQELSKVFANSNLEAEIRRIVWEKSKLQCDAERLEYQLLEDHRKFEDAKASLERAERESKAREEMQQEKINQLVKQIKEQELALKNKEEEVKKKAKVNQLLTERLAKERASVQHLTASQIANVENNESRVEELEQNLQEEKQRNEQFAKMLFEFKSKVASLEKPIWRFYCDKILADGAGEVFAQFSIKEITTTGQTFFCVISGDCEYEYQQEIHSLEVHFLVRRTWKKWVQSTPKRPHSAEEVQLSRSPIRELEQQERQGEEAYKEEDGDPNEGKTRFVVVFRPKLMRSPTRELEHQDEQSQEAKKDGDKYAGKTRFMVMYGADGLKSECFQCDSDKKEGLIKYLEQFVRVTSDIEHTEEQDNEQRRQQRLAREKEVWKKYERKLRRNRKAAQY